MSGLLVAVVEDDPNMLESLEGLLESAGHTALLFSSGEALLSSGRLPDIDCLISDIGLPGIDGIELLRVVLAGRPNLPVLIITASHDQSMLKSALAAGARRVFLKPLNNTELLGAVSAAR